MALLDNLNPNPTLVKKGVLYLQKTPVYIIEKVDDMSGSYVTVYNAHPDQPEGTSPTKAYTVKETEHSQFSGDTPLTKLAKRYYKPKTYRVRVDKPPVFMAEVVDGVNTFNGSEGKGFYEREKDRIVKKDGKLVMEKGKRTGVFITLDSIKWETVVVAPDDIVQDFKANKLLWFGL